MHRMGKKSVVGDAVVNLCWNEEKERRWGTIWWKADRTGQPCGDVESQQACERALDGLVLGYKMNAFAQGCTC